MSQDKEWFYSIDGKVNGPFTESELVSIMLQGTISKGTYVWGNNTSGWRDIVDTEIWARIADENKLESPNITNNQHQSEAKKQKINENESDSTKSMQLLLSPLRLLLQQCLKDNVEIKKELGNITELVRSQSEKNSEALDSVLKEVQKLTREINDLRTNTKKEIDKHNKDISVALQVFSQKNHDIKKEQNAIGESVRSLSGINDMERNLTHPTKQEIVKEISVLSDSSFKKEPDEPDGDAVQKNHKKDSDFIGNEHSELVSFDISREDNILPPKENFSEKHNIDLEEIKPSFQSIQTHDAKYQDISDISADKRDEDNELKGRNTQEIYNQSEKSAAGKLIEKTKGPVGGLFRGPRVNKILVGIDFGSKFTKLAYKIIDGTNNPPITALDMGLAIDNNDCGCIIPSSIGIEKKSKKGREFWYPGNFGEGDNALKTSLLKKAKIIDHNVSEGYCAETQTTFFFWWLFISILDRLRSVENRLEFDNIDFNVSIPVAKIKENDEILIELYKKITSIALQYAMNKQDFLDPDELSYANDSFNVNIDKFSDHISVTPEPVAQVLPYMNYVHGRKVGKHIIIDIGGGTIDFSIFEISNDFKKLELYNTYVHMGAMDNIERNLMTSRQGLGAKDILNLLFSPSKEFTLTQNEKLDIKKYFRSVHQEAKKKECFGGAYEKHKDTDEWKDVNVLLAGGGSYKESAFYHDLCDIFCNPFWVSHAEKHKKYTVTPYDSLKSQNFDTRKCRDIERNMHRMLVAYGLCFEETEYPESFKPYMVEPKKSPPKPHIYDDPWKEQYYV